MKIKTILAGLSFLLTTSLIIAQSELHIPKEIQKAYKNDTRSKDGKPGVNYWQNSVAYNIDVVVTPETRKIDGKETIVFKNNSPDLLPEIVIRLYYDVFKKGNQRGMQVNEEDIGEGVNIKELTVNGEKYDLTNKDRVRRSGTNLTIILTEPLKPRGEVTLGFQWDQKVPLTVRRTGAIDSTSFFVAYWYPQVAVYDDVFGWDRINYTFDTEFYNNLANFEVNITAPDNFLVWATGTLENSSAVLPSKIHERYARAKTSTELVKVVTKEDISNLKLKSNTWNYKAVEVSDFAFAMSDHFLWDALSQEVSGNDVLISTAYPMAKEEDYSQITLVQQKTMKHFSEDIPGIPYPYPTFTTFIGLKGGGMEFPMMANNDGPGEGVTIHEMFHTYFPMYVRINERRFAWMDEGWADFVTALVTHKYFSEEDNTSSLYSNFKLGMQNTIGTIGDLPTVTSSQYMGNNYGYHSYTLPSFTYSLLYQHLGEEIFLKVFREYIRRWAKKSPTPYDFFYTFEDVSGEDLNWLWESWYFKMGYPDVAIELYKNGKLVVKKIGERPVPLSVNVEYQTNDHGKPKTYTTMVSPSVWQDDNKSLSLKIPDGKQVESIIVNADMPDFNELDNFFPPLAERYKKLDLNKGVLGVYKLNEYPVDAIITEKEGVFFYEVTNTSSSGYLLPVDKNNFITTDGTVELSFKAEAGKVVGIVIKIEAYGISATGQKK
ncbi:M1 family metallopeptidase [uncultured Eudoraea sp.]|uniref:M1 family metallopeptidase n=1 Tax=uncultured Eudoraea sp. TaxID=1035614 RepID=UPI002605F07B|nr:M1 family metallopeptidase [uncultured Eudoraea sp.]